MNDKINPFAIRLLDKAFQVAKTVQNPDVKLRTLTEITHRFDLFDLKKKALLVLRYSLPLADEMKDAKLRNYHFYKIAFRFAQLDHARRALALLEGIDNSNKAKGLLRIAGECERNGDRAFPKALVPKIKQVLGISLENGDPKFPYCDAALFVFRIGDEKLLQTALRSAGIAAKKNPPGPYRDYLFCEIAETCVSVGNISRALKYLEELQSCLRKKQGVSDSYSERTYDHISDVYLSLGMRKKAISLANRVFKLAATHYPTGMELRAERFLKLGMRKRAENILDELAVVSARGRNASKLMQIGEYYMQLGQPEKAEKIMTLRTVVNSESLFLSIWYNHLSATYYEKGGKQKALKYLVMALREADTMDLLDFKSLSFADIASAHCRNDLLPLAFSKV
jgi:tetratricopeptide (TPR) repeat protein